MFARFALRPRQLNVSLLDCRFVDNSAGELQAGGAVYIADVDTIRLFRCHFERNTATDAGAVYVHSSTGACRRIVARERFFHWVGRLDVWVGGLDPAS